MIIFFDFFPFDSLGAVPENPGTVICGVRLSIGPIYRGTTVLGSVVKDGSERAILLVSLRNEDTVLGGNEYYALCLRLCSFLVPVKT